MLRLELTARVGRHLIRTTAVAGVLSLATPLAEAAPSTATPAPSSTLAPTVEPGRAHPALPACERAALPSPCFQPKDAYRHDGLFFTFGLSFDYLSYWGSGPRGKASVSDFASGFLVAMGGTPARGLVVGGAFRFASGRNDFHGSPHDPPGYATISVGYLGPFVNWYPNPNDGWHVGGSVGLGLPALFDSYVEDSSGIAVAGTVLGGYGFWIGPQWSFDLRALVSASPATSMVTNDEDTGYRFRTLAAGLSCGLTLH